MKKILGIIAVLVMLLPIMCTAYADTDSVNCALDLVILLDDSGSMYKNHQGHDKESFRYDAASIMLNMCEITGSRAAVYEFSKAHNVFSIPRGIDNLEAIDVDKTAGVVADSYRSRVTTALTERARATYMTEQDGNTPLGNALTKAADVLDAGAANRNGRQPIIVVLADGDDTTEDSVRNAALQRCKINNYKIYTIMLGEDFEHVETMQEMAILTGGCYFELDEASELPKYFSQVLADQTGAELTFNDQLTPLQVEDGSWVIEIDVPNRSVQECNIMVPTNGLSDIALYKPGNELVRPALSQKLYYFEVGEDQTRKKEKPPRFIQYKIMRPQEDSELGKWELRFRAENEKAAKQVSLTVVFNYDLSLQTTIINSPGSTKIEAAKADSIVLESQFYKPSGRPSDDNKLYRGSTENDDAITCKVYLLTNKENTVLDEKKCLTFTPDAIGSKFDLSFCFNDFGGNLNKSGNYYLLVKAEGDGLIRSSDPIPFTIRNEAPVARKVISVAMIVEDPVTGLDKQSEYVLPLADCITDPDGMQDINIKSAKVSSADESIVTAELKTVGDSVSAHLKTTGKVGSTTVSITVQDIENQSITAEIPVTVTSVLAQLGKDYTLNLNAVTPSDANGQYQRGAQVELNAEYKSNESVPMYKIEHYKPEIKMQRIMADETRSSVENSSVVLDGEGGDYRYEAVLTVNGQLLKTQELILSTGNVAPNVKADTVWEMEALIGCEKFPDNLLGHVNTEPWTISFADLFEDSNAADHLSFTYEATGEALTVEEVLEGDALVGLTLTPVAAGTHTFKLTAADDSSEKVSVSQDYTVTVIDQNQITIHIVLLIIVALVAAFVLYKIIHAAIRPKFKNVSLQVSVNSVPQKTYPLSSSQKKEAMGRFTIPSHQFTSVMANKLEISPTKDGAKVTLKKAKELRSATIKMNGKDLFKLKKAVLKLNSGELIATVNNETMSWKLISSAGTSSNRSYGTMPSANKPAGRTSMPRRF